MANDSTLLYEELRDAAHDNDACLHHDVMNRAAARISELEKTLADVRRVAANVPRLRDALRVILDGWHTSHAMHFDREGTGGTNCPACILDHQARMQLRAQLESLE